MKKTVLLTALLFAACASKAPVSDAGVPVIDECIGLPQLTASAIPAKLRVNGSATLTATGGSGRYSYAAHTNASGGTLSQDRWVAGKTPGTDSLTVFDDCANSASIELPVSAAFEVAPARATIKPGTHLTIRVTGTVGAPTFSTSGALPSGGTLSAAGDYLAGPSAATDLITVQDSATGDQALLQFKVTLTAQFHPTSAKLALPTGAWVPLESLEGSGVVTWRVASGVGSVTGARYLAPDAGAGDALIEGHDEFTDETVQVSVRVLTEMTRPSRAQGRRSDLATAVTGDFDGDGFRDLAIGSQESDLARPQGGAVFIFRGSATGLAPTPTWTILPNSDTAQLGAVMAAGDLDGDGHDDLAISEPGADITATDSGAVLLYRMTSEGPVLIRPVLSGLGAAKFGSSLAIADVDADGDNDLIIGSPSTDIAPGTYNTRGVVDVFLLQKGQPISDSGSIRLGGVDLAADGTLRPFSGLRSGRGLVVADLNDDGLTDLAMLTAVNNSLLGTTAIAKNQIAAQVHFGRSGSKHFNETPDLFVVPSNNADTAEGAWRMGLVPKTATSAPLFIMAADQTDSPNLAASGGTAGGQNAGGALLFDLTAQKPTGVTAPKPVQVGPADAFARVYGDAAFINAGRSFTVADLDGDGTFELILGAPFASVTKMVNGANVTTPLVGKLLVYSLAALTAGAVVNKPAFTRFGQTRADTLGTALAVWRYSATGTSLVSVSGRATTELGDFTGRIDAFTGQGDLSTWSVASASIPNKAASQLIGAAIDLAPMGGALRVVVGSPGFSGPAPDNSGNDIDAGQALLFALSDPGTPRVLAEGSSNAPYLRDGGWSAFGGRGVGVDVAMTDFNGDGLPDIVISAPNFTPPTRLADGGASTGEYTTNRGACLAPSAQTPGGVFVHLARADGTYREAYRAWVLRDVIGADGGVAFQRTLVGRGGVIGNFDFDGDGKQDLGATRANGFEVIAGRTPDDPGLAKLTMSCDSLFSSPPLTGANQYTTAPAALGDLTGDGCDEVGYRYTDNGNRSGVIIVFGFGPTCSQSTASWVRISGDSETGLNNLRLGTALARAGKIMANDNRDFVAVTADVYPYQGSPQPTVLLFDIAEIVAKRPVSGERLVSALGDGLVPVPTVYLSRAPGYGRMLFGGDVTNDGKPDLVVSAPGANLNGDGTGAVFVFASGTMVAGPNAPSLTIVSDPRERAAFGQDLAVSGKNGTVPAALGIGAPMSYRSGTANGTAYTLPLDF
jgi:hypothetical protein